MTGVEITRSDGVWNALGPAPAVPFGLVAVFSPVAVNAIGRAASAHVR